MASLRLLCQMLLLLAVSRFTSVNAQCSSADRPRELSAVGTFTSPNYPFTYPANSNCQWRLVAPNPSYVIGLKFGYFNTERNYDFVTLYDGYSTTAAQIARLHGTVALSSTYISRQQYMFVTFTSDGSYQYNGFAANFSSVTGTRLVGNTTARAGIVQVFYNGAWGTVCDDGFTDREARVACFSMGYGHLGTFLGNWYGQGNGTIWLDDVICSGNEVSLGDCRHSGWGVHNCIHGEDVSISCTLQVRLNGSTISSEGRLEVFYNNQWGTVCSDSFTTVDAQVACYSLGFGYTGRTIGYAYGSGSGPIWLDNVECYGNETTLADCPSNGWGAHDCSHSEDISISCSTISTTTTPAPWTTSTADLACSPNTRPLQLTGYTGTFTSQNFPFDYGNDADCQWKILSSEPIGFVMLDFNSFYTETCCDFVVIFDGDSTKDPRIAILSGAYSVPPRGLNSTRRFMFVRFYSDDVYTASGFSATFTSIAPTITECGSVLHPSPNGTAVAPGWGPSCYITTSDTAFLNTQCRDLIQNLPNLGDFNELLGRGGNFGCGASNRDDFIGADYVCQDDFQQTLSLSSVPSATKLIVCIRLPLVDRVASSN